MVDWRDALDGAQIVQHLSPLIGGKQVSSVHHNVFAVRLVAADQIVIMCNSTMTSAFTNYSGTMPREKFHQHSCASKSNMAEFIGVSFTQIIDQWQANR